MRYVNLNLDWPCDCPDAQFRPTRGPCKHECAARLQAGDSKLIMALGNMLEAAEANLKAHTRRARRERRKNG